MSIIAKLSLNTVTDYGTGKHSALGCIAANETMGMYAGAEEDRCFSKATPWGEMNIVHPHGAQLAGQPCHVGNSPQFYVMLVAEDESFDPYFPGAVAKVPVVCRSVTRFAYDGVRVEITEEIPYGKKPYDVGARNIERLNWRMQVDNPPAERQFVPGRKYWVAIYPTDHFDRDAAISAAHTPAPEPENQGCADAAFG